MPKLQNIRADVLAQVEPLLPVDGEGVRPRDIARKLPMLAVTTVRHAISDLVVLGRARAEGPDMNKRYWRVRS